MPHILRGSTFQSRYRGIELCDETTTYGLDKTSLSEYPVLGQRLAKGFILMRVQRPISSSSRDH
jgi:hypothetical protein